MCVLKEIPRPKDIYFTLFNALQMKVCFEFFILFHIIIASADARDDFEVIAASQPLFSSRCLL